MDFLDHFNFKHITFTKLLENHQQKGDERWMVHPYKLKPHKYVDNVPPVTITQRVILYKLDKI